MIAHCASVNVMRIKATSHLATLKHSEADLGILKRQQALGVTSRKIVGLFPEQLWFQFVPVLHRLQGSPAAQG